MHFPHARLHRARLREFVAGPGIPVDLLSEPLLIACPQYGDEYFADLDPNESESQSPPPSASLPTTGRLEPLRSGRAEIVQVGEKPMGSHPGLHDRVLSQ